MLPANPDAKTRYAVVRTEGETRRFALTEEQYKKLARVKDSEPATKLFTLPNRDGGIAYSGELRSLTGFEDIPVYTGPTCYYCDFGVKHTFGENCDCPEVYNMNSLEFRQKFNELFPGGYANRSTEEQRKKIFSL